MAIFFTKTLALVKVAYVLRSGKGHMWRSRSLHGWATYAFPREFGYGSIARCWYDWDKFAGGFQSRISNSGVEASSGSHDDSFR